MSAKSLAAFCICLKISFLNLNIFIKLSKQCKIKKQNIIGKTEIEVARMISIHMLESGASGNSFDPIVASGKNGAIPHHSPSEKIIYRKMEKLVDKYLHT